MGGAVFVKVKDADWRFDPEAVFDALRQSFAGQPFWQGRDPLQLRASGFADGWEVNLNEELTEFIIEAPPAPMIELVAWVRGYVPDEVVLEIFDDQLSVDVAQLPPGLSADQVRAQLFPEAWKVEQMSPSEPPPLEERMRSGPPPHIAELMDREKPPQTGPDPE